MDRTLAMRIKDALESPTYGLAALLAKVDHEKGTSVVFPAAANAVTCTDKNDAGVTPWDNGAWVELVADSGGQLHVVEAVDIIATSGSGNYEIDIGVGAASSEVVVSTIAFNTNSNYQCRSAQIAANQRIAARLRSAVSSGRTASVKVQLRSYNLA